MKHLVIPDAHASPDWSLERFKWLGQLVCDLRPDVVISIGDWADMPSLSSYDVGKKSFEGRRYRDDINAAREAQTLFFTPIRKQKKKLPRFIMLEGNHEQRIKRAINDDAKLDGTISPDDLGYREYGWEYVEYRGSTPGVIMVDGVAYAHYFTSGVMGRPIGGVRPAYTLLQKQHMSCTQGHIHTFDLSIQTTGDDRKIMGCVCGVYTDEELDYAGNANDLWWRGVLLKDNVNDGTYDAHMISMHTIKKEYR